MAWFYERLFFEVVMVMAKEKKYRIQDTMSIKISFIHCAKYARVMLPVVFGEFELVCIFSLFFYFHYHCQLVKRLTEATETTESLLKMMKNTFYFASKTLFVLKIFKFLP